MMLVTVGFSEVFRASVVMGGLVLRQSHMTRVDLTYTLPRSEKLQNSLKAQSEFCSLRGAGFPGLGFTGLFGSGPKVQFQAC